MKSQKNEMELQIIFELGQEYESKNECLKSVCEILELDRGRMLNEEHYFFENGSDDDPDDQLTYLYIFGLYTDALTLGQCYSKLKQNGIDVVPVY